MLTWFCQYHHRRKISYFVDLYSRLYWFQNCYANNLVNFLTITHVSHWKCGLHNEWVNFQWFWRLESFKHSKIYRKKTHTFQSRDETGVIVTIILYRHRVEEKENHPRSDSKLKCNGVQPHVISVTTESLTRQAKYSAAFRLLEFSCRWGELCFSSFGFDKISTSLVHISM